MTYSLPPIDLHSHINPRISTHSLEQLGAVVFAASRSLNGYSETKSRSDQVTIWGVGCHPRDVVAQASFDEQLFQRLLATTPFVSEVGLDSNSKVPLQYQLLVLNTILESVQQSPRIVSVHSFGKEDLVLDALTHIPISRAVLHWWKGSPSQTWRAVDLGCYFSFNSAGIHNCQYAQLIPKDRIFTETDHPFGNRRASGLRQPGFVEDVEEALASSYNITKSQIRKQIWLNFRDLVKETRTLRLLPLAIQRMLNTVD